MERTWLATITVILVFFTISNLSAQIIQSSGGGTGAWSDPNSWTPATVPTTANSTLVEILNGHTITVAASPGGTIDQLFVRSGGTLIINASTALALNNGTGDDLTVDAGGTLSVSGTLTLPISVLSRITINGTVNNSGTFSSATAAKLRFNAGSNYFHQFTDNGTIPLSTWNDLSTVNIVGYTSGNAAAPSGLNQNFGNFIWNAPNQDTEIDLAGQPSDVDGDFLVEDTGAGAIYYNASGVGNSTLSIAGNFEVNNASIFIFIVALGASGTFDVAGDLTINGQTTYFTDTDDVDVIIGGDFIHTSGEIDFSLTSGIVNVSLSGDLNRTGGTFVSSGGPATISFDGVALQTVTNAISSSGSISYTLPAGSDVLIPAGQFLSGGGTFTLDGTLRLGSTDASGALQNGTSAGNVRVTTRQYNSGATIIYEGTAAQFIGSGHPSASGITTLIDNASGVSLAANVTIGGLLHLDNGNLSLGIRTLTLNDELIVDTGNSLVITSSSSISIGLGDAGPFGTLVTSGSSSLNNLTFIRNGQTLFLGSSLGVNGTLTHDGNINFAGFSLTIDGPYTITSGALTGNSSSSLVIGGSGAISSDVPLQGTLGTLTINRPVVVTNTTSINIATALNILNGTYQGSGSVTLADNVILTRADGIITKSISIVDNYSLVYTSTAPINTGSELVTSPSSALFDLTINPSSSVTIDASVTSLTVNGTLTLSSGSFISNAKPIFLEGNVVSNATGNFTGSLVTFSNNSTLSGGVSLELDDVAIETGATLDLGSVNLRVGGDFTPATGSIMQPGTATTFFNGTTTLLLPDVATAVQFNNVTISSNSSLIISCVSCGTENNRAGIQVDGVWNSNNFGAVFNPAPNIGGNIVTAVRFTGGSQTIGTLPTHAFWDLNLGGTGTVTIALPLNVTNDLEIEGSKTLSTGVSNEALSIGGDFLFDGGTFTPNQGTVTFNGNANQTIDRLSGSGSASFFNITVNKASGNFIIAMDVDLQNAFTVSSNTTVDFDGTGGTDIFTLLSTAGRTALIAPILSPADPALVGGSVTTQRYMDGEGLIYRYLSSPVLNPQVVDLQGEIPITGSFTGTSFPPQTSCTGCTPCTGCGTNNQSMFRYNGALTGTLNQRYEDFPANANTETMAAGRGYVAFVRSGVASTTWNVRGQPNRGTINFTPLAFTGTGQNDSWNLVGNPYPAPIDWQVADGATEWTRTNIDPTIYTWDESTQAFATFNRITLSQTNNGSRYVATGQGFWIRTTAGSPAMTAREGVKAVQQPTFFREGGPKNYLRLTLSGEGRKNETLIHLNIEGATDNFDPSIDSYRFPDAFGFYTISEDSKQLVINAVGSMQCSKEVKVGMSGVKPGLYSIRYSELESFKNPLQIYLIDNYIGKSFNLDDTKPVYDFEVTSDSTSFGDDRFKIIFSQSPVNTDLVTSSADVCNGQDAKVQIMESQENVSYYATINGNTVSESFSGNGAGLTLSLPKDKIADGENQVIIMAKASGCDAVPLNQGLVVKVEIKYNVVDIQHRNICKNGSSILKASGAPSEGMYRWYESEDSTLPIAGQTQSEFITPVLEKSKTYYVAIVNDLGCEGERTAVKAEVIHLEDASITFNENKLVSNHTEGNQWFVDDELIDGATGKEITPIRPGLYKLEVKKGECSTSSEMEYGLSGVKIYPNPFTNIFVINVESENEVKARIFNSLGVEIGTFTLKELGKRRRTAEIYLGSNANGFYLIQIQDGDQIHRKKILKK